MQKRQNGTCGWIQEREVFEKWLSPEFVNGLKVLWINGSAGFGKIILCASVVEYLLSTLDTPVGYFFITSESRGRDDPFFAVRAWVSQLVCQHQGAFECAHHTWEDDADIVSSRDTCLGVLAQITQLVPGCTFVIDGLDECTHLHTQSTSAAAFIDTITTSLSSSTSRLLLVSRDEPRIRYSIARYCTEYTISPEDVRLDTASVSKEIIDRKLHKKLDEFRDLLSETMTSLSFPLRAGR